MKCLIIATALAATGCTALWNTNPEDPDEAVLRGPLTIVDSTKTVCRYYLYLKKGVQVSPVRRQCSTTTTRAIDNPDGVSQPVAPRLPPEQEGEHY